MGKDSKIAWTDHTWNPWQGCHKVSDGCKNCYMFRDKKRYGQYASVVVRSKPATFNRPFKWDEPAKVFVCSWSDFWIEEADEWRGEAFNIIKQTPHLTYLLLTKRPELIDMRWRDFNNVWLGVTTENQPEANKRIAMLCSILVKIRFLSIEPMLSEISLRWLPAWNGMATKPREWGKSTNEFDGLRQLDWVIVSAESGPGRRPCKIEWVKAIVEQCKEAGVPVFVKQLDIDGKVSSDINEWPEDLRIQEFPVEGK